MPRSILLALSCALAGCLPLLDRSAVPDPGVPTCVAFSPDGAKLAVGSAADETGQVRLLDAATLRGESRFDVDMGVTEVTFSPQGDRLLLSGRRIFPDSKGDARKAAPQVHEFTGWFDLTGNLNRDQPVHRADILSADRMAIAWAESGKGPRQWLVVSRIDEPNSRGDHPDLGERHLDRFALATAAGPMAYQIDDRLFVRELFPDAEPFQLPPAHRRTVEHLALTADGNRLVSASAGDAQEAAEVIVWDLRTRQVERRLPGVAGRFDKLILSDDGRFLAACLQTDAGCRVWVWDLETGAKRPALPCARPHVPVFDPTGERLAYLDASDEVQVISTKARD